MRLVRPAASEGLFVLDGDSISSTTNADTWWRSLVTVAGDAERIHLAHPPTAFYTSTEYEEDDLPAASRQLDHARGGVSRRRQRARVAPRPLVTLFTSGLLIQKSSLPSIMGMMTDAMDCLQLP
ncbi:hypothetical protein FOA52_000463 [Chlamydomonas sp. UWO 241]|nr:hypothetical protein FOA52_000463 [Chlamydomonas sp. UWO 241]